METPPPSPDHRSYPRPSRVEKPDADEGDESLRLDRALDGLHEQQGRIEDLVSEVDLLSQWLGQLRDGIESLLGSKRWRLGNWLIGTLGRFAGLPRTPPHIQTLRELAASFSRWQEKKQAAPSLNRALDSRVTRGSTVGTFYPYASERRGGCDDFDVVILANIGWEARFQRPQQMALQFARHGHRVFYFVAQSPLPEHDTEHDSGSFRAERVAPNITQLRLATPPGVDIYACAFDTSTCRALSCVIDDAVASYDIVGAVTMVHLPCWTPVALALREKSGWPVVYDCMDEWRGFPLIGPSLLEAEIELVHEADLVSVTSSLLHDKWKEAARSCVLVRNGVDAAYFESQVAPNDLLDGVERPIIGYYGALAEWVDFELIHCLATQRPDWNFVLIGDVFVDDLLGLDALANVILLGRKPFEQMPLYLYHFDACIIPFKINDMTHAVDPVKFYEFMSAGKPVVASRLQALEPYADLLYLAEDLDSFVRQIDTALQERQPELALARVALARENDWEIRYWATREAVAAASPSLSVIIVSYENERLTRECVESVLENTLHPDFEVIVVDNASSDGSANFLRHLQLRESRVQVIQNEDNRGFAEANNQGLALARGDLLVLLNNDTVVPRGWADPLARHLLDPEIGLVGPTTNFAGNEAKIPVAYQSLDQMPEFAARRRRDEAGRCFDIPVLAMFCVMMRREVFEAVGPLDETFEVGMFEDDDYSLRVRQKGLRTVCAEDAFVHHVGQAAFKKLLETGEYQRIWNTNRAHFESKWGSWQAHRPRVEDGD